MGFIRTLASTGLASEKMSHPLAGKAKKFVIKVDLCSAKTYHSPPRIR